MLLNETHCGNIFYRSKILLKIDSRAKLQLQKYVLFFAKPTICQVNIK